MSGNVPQRLPRLAAPRRARRAPGFTLIETGMALVIVGFAVVASFRLFASCAHENRVSTQMTVAMLLAQNVREAITGSAFNDPQSGTAVFGPEAGENGLVYFDDIDDFDGQSLNPPIDSLRAPITSMGQYTQVVTVVPVFPNKLNSNLNDANLEINKTTYTGAARVRVRVLYQPVATQPAIEVYRAAWVRLDH